MASKREKLEKRAGELGLSFVPETSDEELQELINDFQNDDSIVEDEQDDSGASYFKCEAFPSLKVVVGDPDPTKGEVAPKVVAFKPYLEQRRGVEGLVRVGYLKTSNGSAIKKCDADPNVVSLTKDEYHDATTPVEDEAGVQISGYRATE